MLGALDFLFQGQAPANVTTGSAGASNVPAWLSDYSMQLISNANAVGNTPYTPYPGPKVAPFSADQTAAQQMIRANAGAFTPTAVAAATHAAGVPTAAQPYYNAAGADVGAGVGMTGMGADPSRSGLSVAAPWLNAASGTFTGNTVGQYMNPYISDVMNQATVAANRNFMESTMPQLADTFTRNGQFGSTGHQLEADRAARDLALGLQSQYGGMLGNAYTAAQGAYSTDAARMAALAGTAGGLGTAGQNALLTGGRNMADLAAASGNIGTAQGALGLNADTTAANLARTAQGMTAADAASLAASGATQQGQTQTSLNQALTDFNAQLNWPKTQLQFQQSMLSGLPYSQNTTQTYTGPSYVGYGASPVNTAASIYQGLTGAFGSNGTGQPAPAPSSYGAMIPPAPADYNYTIPSNAGLGTTSGGSWPMATGARGGLMRLGAGIHHVRFARGGLVRRSGLRALEA
jgi:hypothetical protein